MAQRYNFTPIEEVLALYTVSKPEEVQNFLEKNSFLIPHRLRRIRNIADYQDRFHNLKTASRSMKYAEVVIEYLSKSSF